MTSRPLLESTDIAISDEPIKAGDLDFYALLRRQNSEGRVFFNQRRAILFDLDALNTLRQQMIAMLGQQMAKSILLRFGYTQGYKDAEFLKEQVDWATDDDWLKAGFMLQTLKGLAYVDMEKVSFNRETNHFFMQGIWHNAFEAEYHLNHGETGDSPICWILAGYASGYATRFFGQELMAVETECAGKGDAQCSFEIRLLDEWGLKVEPYLVALHEVELSDQFEVNQHLQEQARQLTLLNTMSTELNLAKTINQALSIAIAKTGQIIKADHISVALFNPALDTFNEFLLDKGQISSGSQWPLEDTAFGKAVQENRTITISDLNLSPFREHGRLVKQGLRSTIVIPMAAGSRIVGALNVNSRNVNAYGPKDEKLLWQVTALLAAAIENKRLFEQTQKRAHREQILREITSQVRSQVDVDTILQTAAKEVGRALKRPIFVYLNHHHTDNLESPDETKEEQQ